MSPENTHKLMGFYMEVLILGVNTMYMLVCFLSCFLGCIGLTLGFVDDSLTQYSLSLLCQHLNSCLDAIRSHCEVLGYSIDVGPSSMDAQQHAQKITESANTSLEATGRWVWVWVGVGGWVGGCVCRCGCVWVWVCGWVGSGWVSNECVHQCMQVAHMW